MTAGRAPKRNGDRAERGVVCFLQERGFAAEHFPWSGAGGCSCADTAVALLGTGRRIDIKVCSNGFRELNAKLTERDFLVVRADAREPPVALPLHRAAEIAAVAERVRR